MRPDGRTSARRVSAVEPAAGAGSSQAAALRRLHARRRHFARCASRSTAFIFGSKRLPTFHVLRISSRSFQKPIARPARNAAPSAVVSIMRGRSTGTSSRSAWNCMSRSFCEAPPSTLNTG